MTYEELKRGILQEFDAKFPTTEWSVYPPKEGIKLFISQALDKIHQENLGEVRKEIEKMEEIKRLMSSVPRYIKGGD
jgi:hypothetical protein